MHLTSGDINAGRLTEAGLPGRIVACIDVLHEGPTPAGVEGAAWRQLRAGFAAARGWATHEWALGRLADAATAIDGAVDEDEVVLWFEHDLVCQLMLVRILAQLDGLTSAPLSLICIGHHPEVPSFRALGDLNVAQTSALFRERNRVTSDVRRTAREVWSAFAASDPTALARVAADELPPLPWLAPALRRHLEQFPSTRDGLGRTERTILTLLADGVRSRSELFRAAQALEATPFMGDTIFWSYLDDLGRGAEPLVAADGDAVRLTPAGRDVLDGRRDAIDARGIDRWLGGVHVQSSPAPHRQPVWRWNADAGRVERA